MSGPAEVAETLRLLAALGLGLAVASWLDERLPAWWRRLVARRRGRTWRR
ncbi:MAG TPA: hypothetical protein VF041_23250 [Gemmatimonadaceae bacterium]